MARTKIKTIEKAPQSICDACATMVPADEAQTCEHCDGTFCDDHIGDLDHECVVEEDR